MGGFWITKKALSIKTLYLTMLTLEMRSRSKHPASTIHDLTQLHFKVSRVEAVKHKSTESFYQAALLGAMAEELSEISKKKAEHNSSLPTAAAAIPLISPK